MVQEPLLAVRGLVKSFGERSGIRRALRLGPRRRTLARALAVDDVSLDVGRLEVLGIVGESGSGKTTLARCLVRLYEPDRGEVLFDGHNVFAAGSDELREIRRRMQLIYQDPYSSLNPVMRVGDAIVEPAQVHGAVRGRAAGRQLVEELLVAVGLSPSDARRFPRQLSGGQRQRVAIARALAVDPTLVIADEAVSALDVSVQAQILNLLSDLVINRRLSMIFISHQLAVIAQLADRVAVMYLGRIVETGRVADVFGSPSHPYTGLLLASHPSLEWKPPDLRPKPRLESQWTWSGVGCRFRARCSLAEAVCEQVDPPAVSVGSEHLAWCHKAAPVRGAERPSASDAEVR